MKKKPTFELRTLKSFIVYSLHRQTHQFQVLTPRFWSSCPSTRSFSAKPTLCHTSGVFEVLSKPSLPMRDFIKRVLIVWGSGCKSCRRPTARLKNWGYKKPTAMKKSMRFFTIRGYRLYSKLLKRSWLAVSTTILWLTILALRRLANYWPKSTTGQASATMPRLT